MDGVDYAKMNNYARYNDGMTPLYGNAALEGYRMRDPDHAEYPNADFRAAMLKDTKPYTRAGIGLSGGSSAVRYNAHFGYAGEGDIYRLGAVSDYNRLNVHTNIDASITRRLRARVSFFGGMTFRRSPKYGYGTSNDDAPATGISVTLQKNIRSTALKSIRAIVQGRIQRHCTSTVRVIYTVCHFLKKYYDAARTDR